MNDGFVLFQWGKHMGAKNALILQGGNTEFTRKTGMLVKNPSLGFAVRSWRCSMLVKDGNVETNFVDPDLGNSCSIDPFVVLDADIILAYLKGLEFQCVSQPRLSFEG